jgi:hypothetical protein
MKMMNLVMTNERTTPLVWLDPTLSATTLPDSVPLRRLISVGVTLVVSWALFNFGLPVLAWAFPSSADSIKPVISTRAISRNPTLGELLDGWQEVELPTALGYNFDGSLSKFAPARFRGVAADKEHLPANPRLGDMYRVGPLFWLWMVPNGASIPTWIDP